jgi:CRP/FNR family transcriptional regulator
MLADAFTTAPDIAGHSSHASSHAFVVRDTVHPITPRDPLLEHVSGGSLRTLKPREHVFLEGDRANSVYWVESGHVCIYRMVSDGRRQVLDFAYPGDIIGLGSAVCHAANAQAIGKTRLRSLPVNVLHDLARRDGKIATKLYDALSRELLAARELLFTISQRTAAERIAAFLMALARRNERRGESPSELVLPMTRCDIADFLGLTIETVSRTLTRFRNEGLIEIEQCILVSILEPKALEAAAGSKVNDDE